jgi:hypothetical protein
VCVANGRVIARLVGHRNPELLAIDDSTPSSVDRKAGEERSFATDDCS